MDIFEEELLAFWNALNEYEVNYIMVGGIAINLHGYQRSTEDIDVWLEDNLDNRRRFRMAFKQYTGIDFPMLETMQIIPGWTNLNLNNGLRLDLMLGLKGLESYSFEESLQLASKAEINGIIVPFLHLNQLIEAKKAANRPKDQIDVIYLEKIKEIRDKGQ